MKKNEVKKEVKTSAPTKKTSTTKLTGAKVVTKDYPQAKGKEVKKASLPKGTDAKWNVNAPAKTSSPKVSKKV